MLPSDTIWLIVSLYFTLVIFSYLLGDNFIFRLTSYIFIGITAAYLAVIVFYQVILGRLVWPLMTGTNEQRMLLVVPLLLSILLLLKLSPRWSSLGNIPLGFLAGVGAALITGGALFGTITAQTGAAIDAFNTQPLENQQTKWIEGGFLLLGTISTLAYFHFGAARKRNTENRPAWVEPLAKLGKIFIGFTLGALFVGVYSAALVSLIDRIQFVFNSVSQVLVSLP